MHADIFSAQENQDDRISNLLLRQWKLIRSLGLLHSQGTMEDARNEADATLDHWRVPAASLGSVEVTLPKFSFFLFPYASMAMIC